jgi:hypothetical protein
MEDANNPEGNGYSLAEAAQAIERSMKPEPEPTDNQEELKEEAQEQEAEDTTEEVAEDAEAQPEEAEEAPEEPRKYKVKINDEELEVTEEELINGYQRQQDYTRKTTEIAPMRKQLEEDRQRITQAEQSLQQQLAFSYQVAMQFIPPKPDQTLLHQDPISYFDAKEKHENAVEYLKQLDAAFMQSQQRQSEQSNAMKQKIIQENTTKLIESVPELQKRETRDQWVDDVSKGLTKNYGITPEEIATVEDYRMLVIAADALKWRKSREQAPNVKAKVQQAPVALSPDKRKTPQEMKARDKQESMQRLKKSGRVEDAALAIQQILRKK